MPDKRNPNYQATLFSVVKISGEGAPDREFLVNFSNHETKVWLTKTMIWGLMNGKTVSITRASQRDTESRQLFIPQQEAMSRSTG